MKPVIPKKSPYKYRLYLAIVIGIYFLSFALINSYIGNQTTKTMFSLAATILLGIGVISVIRAALTTIKCNSCNKTIVTVMGTPTEETAPKFCQHCGQATSIEIK